MAINSKLSAVARLKGPFIPATKPDARKAADAARKYWESLDDSDQAKRQLGSLGSRVEIDDVIIASNTAVSSGTSITGGFAVAVSVGQSPNARSMLVPGVYVVEMQSGKPKKTIIEFDLAEAKG